MRYRSACPTHPPAKLAAVLELFLCLPIDLRSLILRSMLVLTDINQLWVADITQMLLEAEFESALRSTDNPNGCFR